MLTLAQFAIAAQADPKWVQNAVATLGLYLRYTEAEARRLGLSRVLNTTLGMPLRQAWEIAEDALRHPEARDLIVSESLDGSVRAAVDVTRYLSSFTAALALARRHEPKSRGRPLMIRERSAAEEADAFGLDLSLYRANRWRSLEERARELDENADTMNFFRRRLRK
jgi:hypothetical protein